MIHQLGNIFTRVQSRQHRKRLISFTLGSSKGRQFFGQQFPWLCSHMLHLSSFATNFPQAHVCGASLARTPRRMAEGRKVL